LPLADFLWLTLLVVAVVVSAVILFDRSWPGGKEWEMEHARKWFLDNKYCMVCGKLNDWQPEGGIQYDPRDGRPYMQEVWGCSTSGHTFNRLVEMAQRRDYGDATASET